MEKVNKTKKTSSKAFHIFILIICVILMIAYQILMVVVNHYIAKGDEVIFNSFPVWNSYLMIVTAILLAGFFYMALANTKLGKSMAEENIVFAFLELLREKGSKLIAIIILTVSFLSFTAINITTYESVRENEIVVCRLFNEKKYTYADIERVEMGIKKKKTSFYYDIILKDGRKINILGGSFEQYSDLPYELDIQRLDNIMKERNVERSIDLRYIKQFKEYGYDEEFIKNVLIILEVEK